MGYQETREIYVRVNSQEDYDVVKKVFDKYEVSTLEPAGVVLKNVWVYMEEMKFVEFLDAICEAIPNCLILASCNKYHSVSGPCGYDIYAHYPNREQDWDDRYSNADVECPVYINHIDGLKSCLEWIRRARLVLEPEDQMAIYKIWGKEVDEKAFLAAENDDSAEKYLESLIVKNPITVGNVSKKSKSVYRLCAIAKDDATMQLIKNAIIEYVENGNQIVSKATYVEDKRLMYLIASDFYEEESSWEIEEVIDDLIENAEGKFIILNDAFKLFDYAELYGVDSEHVSEEGYAVCSLGAEMKEFAWDCMMFDQGMEDNIDINVTDVLGYLAAYGFEIELDEKVYISSFC